MQALRSIRPAFLFLPFLLVWLLIGTSDGAPDQQPFTAIRRGGGLALSIPYRATHSGLGRLTVEILDPESHVIGSASQLVKTVEGEGVWQQEISTDKPLPMEDLVWHRIRYRFQYNGASAIAFEQTHSVSEILRRPLVRVLSQASYLTGSQAAIRAIVSDSNNHEIPGISNIRVDLLVPSKPARTLFKGRLNRRGTTEAQFRFPTGITGNFHLRYVADTPLGPAEAIEPVRLEDKVSILLTTEKRLYQPGQTVHIRALVLDRADHHAVASGRLTFEVQDSRGNKVYKKEAQTDEFGISSGEFSLADEVNLGTYKIHALMGDPAAPSNSAETTFTTDRYVLPKFKVAVNFAATNGKPRRDYRPGDHVTGTVQANYFFGKSLDNVEVSVKASGMDVEVFEAASAKGHTDNAGAYHFDLTLPGHFAGRALNGDAAQVLVEAIVKDGSGHSEVHGEPITVSESALLITAIPEGGTLAPGLVNTVYVFASYADGSPSVAQLQVRNAGEPDQTATTDKRGVAIVHITPREAIYKLSISADDKLGNRVSKSVPLLVRGGQDQLLVRADRAVYRAGDRMSLALFSTAQRGAVYVDIVKDGQTVSTRDLDLSNGHAEVQLSVTPDLAGTLDVNAYVFGGDGQVVSDHRLVFVQPAAELHVEATSDARIYKPGADARVHFRVTNERGDGVRAALGLQVVDEAVFALAESQPGFAKTFFYLEQEVMKPRIEVHSFTMRDLLGPTTRLDDPQRDRDTGALFAAADTVHPNMRTANFGAELPQQKQPEYAGRYRKALETQVKALGEKLPTAKARDAWGTELRVEPAGRFYRVRSAGPDRKFVTGDDIGALFDPRRGVIGVNPGHFPIGITIEHRSGPLNGHAEMSGDVYDQSGTAIEGASIRLVHQDNGITLRARTNVKGTFNLAGLALGRYWIDVSRAGFNDLRRPFVVRAGDRAEAFAVLSVSRGLEPLDRFEMNDVVVNGAFHQGVARNISVMAMAPMAFAGAAPRAMRKDVAIVASRVDVAQETHVRSYFPEALYINPEIISDRDGNASISIPIADSITTWRLAAMASTTAGSLGSASAELKVFQDFFVDLDLPVTLTQGDQVTIPVGIYNYAGQRGDVSLSLHQDDWFSMVEDRAEKNVTVDSGRVGGSSFSLEAKRIGKFKLTLSASMNGTAKRQDIVVREIEVLPNGREQNAVFNGRLEHSAQQTVRFPANALPDASKIFVRLYPGPISQVVEGMDAILRMPGGCFEQTSSSTYPNILALDYMKRTKKLTPEVHAKAEGFIANGYQRLLTFEVRGGGFSWFGQAPANKILTAYGLMEFSDMSKVHDVDPNVIARTRDWLVSQQQPDGGWKPDTSFINEGVTNRFNSDQVRITAYIAWSLQSAGYRGPAIEKARHFIAEHLNSKLDPYTLAVLANFEEGDSRVMQMLLNARVEAGDQVYWNSEETGVYATGKSAAIETTGLAVQALLKARQSPEVARKALAYIAAKKDASGTWGTTQATIMALRALLLASEGTVDARGDVEITLNGRLVEKLALTSKNSDVYRQFVLPGVGSKDADKVEMRFNGTGGLAYQVVGQYFVPWDVQTPEELLSIDIAYDRTRLAQNDIVGATARLRNDAPKVANMVMVDLGIPPGFELLSEDLEALKDKTANAKSGKLEKFSLTATQAILYFNALAPKSSLDLHYRLRAKYPVRARTFSSRIYEYYDPAVNAVARPQRLEIVERLK